MGAKVSWVWCITPRRWGEILFDIEEMKVKTCTGELVVFPEAMEYISDIQGFHVKWHMTSSKNEEVVVRVYVIMNYEEEEEEDGNINILN